MQFTQEWSYKTIMESEPDESQRIVKYYDNIMIRGEVKMSPNRH